MLSAFSTPGPHFFAMVRVVVPWGKKEADSEPAVKAPNSSERERVQHMRVNLCYLLGEQPVLCGFDVCPLTLE